MNSQPEEAVGLRRRMQLAVRQPSRSGISSAQADGFFWLRIHSPGTLFGVLILSGALLALSPAHAAPKRRLPPVLPPHSLTPLPRKRLTPRVDARRATPQIRAARRKLAPLPPTGSKLSAKPAPRRPSRVAATGRTNPDRQSIGLADQRLRANAAAPVFSLEDAIALSLANNPRRAEAQAAVNAATANIGAVGAQGKFQVGANGTTEYGRNTTTSNALANASNPSASSGSSGGTDGGGTDGGGTDGGGTETGGTSTSAPSPSRSFLRFDQLTVDASQPLIDGGRVRASTRQARYQAVAQIYQLAQTEQDLILGTTLGYLDVLRAAQLLRVTNANLSVSQERLRIARVRFSVGASARLDVLRAETDLANARSLRISAVNALGTNNSKLNILLGRAPETPLRLAEITRLNLPNVAYNIPASSVLTPAQSGAGNRGATGNAGNTGVGNANAGSANAGSANAGNANAGNANGGNANGANSNSNATGNANGTGNTGTGNGNRAGNGSGNTGNRAGNAGNSAGNAGASGDAGTTGNAGTSAASGNAATGGTGATGAVFGGGSAPQGNTSNATIGATNSTTPGASGNTTNQSGAAGSTRATGTAGATNPTGAANPSGATTAGTGANGSANGGATATTGGATATGTTGSTASLSGGGVAAGASAGLQSLSGSTRQSLAVTQAQIGAAEAAVEIAKSGRRPQLGLNLGALLRNPATFLGNFGASIGLGLAQNLFDSGRTRNQVDTARAALAQLQARLAGQRLEVAGAIETSLLSLDSAQRRQLNSETGVRSAQEALRVAQIGFRSGVRTTLDLADAQAALLSAQTDAVNARFDVADAQATLAAGVGIYTVEAQNARQRAIREQQEAAEQAQRQFEILQPKPKKKRKKFLGIF